MLGQRRAIVLLICVLYMGNLVMSEEKRVTKVEPSKVSIAGEAQLTISGQGFAENQFNFGEGNEHLGNKVVLFSDTRTAECTIIKDGCTEEQIVCYTPAMPADKYRVRVFIDGDAIPDEDVCNGNQDSCTVELSVANTPTLLEVSPTSGSTGDIITMRGKIVTNRYLTTAATASNGRENKILRVYLGPLLCDLRDPTSTTEDGLYGIMLDNDGKSLNGWLKCKHTTAYVGRVNASVIIDKEYGRAEGSLESLLVGSDMKLYRYMSYANVTSISPASGSKKGGTRLTITGANFDDTDAEPSIMIAGTKCTRDPDVPITSTQIVCVTQEEPEAQPKYAGNRGLIQEIWNGSVLAPAEMGSLSSSDDNYMALWKDSADFLDVGNDRFNARFTGFFISPLSADFRFYIKGDDDVTVSVTVDDSTTATATGHSSNDDFFSDPAQESEKVTLEKGKAYFTEILLREYNGRGYFQFAARSYKSEFNAFMTGSAMDEKHQVTVTSDVDSETQNFQFEIPTAQTAVDEVQEVRATGSTDAQFRLGMFGQYTKPLTTLSSADDVKKAVEKLSMFDSSLETVSVTDEEIEGGMSYRITFATKYGDLPELTSKMVDSERTDATITVNEVTAGKAPLTHFSLSMDDNIFSRPIPVTAGAEKVEEELLDMFGVRCPADFGEPSNRKYLQDYEEEIGGTYYGTRTSEEPPFCGRFSVLNPEIIVEEKENYIDLSLYKYVCLAYRGEVKGYNMKFYYLEDDGETWNSVWKWMLAPEKPEDTPEDGWVYSCTNLLENAKNRKPDQKAYKLNQLRIYRKDGTSHLYVDSVAVLAKGSTYNYLDVVDRRMPQGKPNDIIIRGVKVVKESAGNYTITLDPHHCGNDFPMFQLGFYTTKNNNEYTLMNNNDLVATVKRFLAATRPVEGALTIGFKGETTAPIAAFAEAQVVEDELNALSSAGDVKVVREGDCANYNYVITYLTLPGDQPNSELDKSKLVGKNVNAVEKTLQDGSLWFNPAQGDVLRTVHSKPQVMVDINNVPSRCAGNCDFEWTDAATPTVTSATGQGSKHLDTKLDITGTKFDGDTMANNMVTIAGVPCEVTSATATLIKCDVGNGPPGTYDVNVNVLGKGDADTAGTFQYLSSITGVDPLQGSLGGGTSLTVTGYGFHENAVVKVGGRECTELRTVKGSSEDELICNTPSAASASTADVAIIVEQGEGEVLTFSDDFTYNAGMTPIVSGMTPTSGPVTGGLNVTLTGTSLGSSGTVTLCGVEAETIWGEEQIVFVAPSNPPGNCRVMVHVAGVGIADTRDISEFEYILKITKLYPWKGSLYGGTRVTIEGDQFQEGETEVTIGGVGCDIQADTFTTTKFVCMIRDTTTTHTVDNMGSHPVHGQGYAWNPKTLTVHVGDLVNIQWHFPDEIDIKMHVYEVESPSSDEPKEGGFSSGDEKTKNGNVIVYGSEQGIIYYSSGDIGIPLSFKGKIVVEERPSSLGLVSVKVGNHEAVRAKSGTAPASTGSCEQQLSPLPGCINDDEPTEEPADFGFYFSKCHSPTATLENRQLLQITPNDDVGLVGTGLGAKECQNEVKIGAISGSLTDESSSTKLTFRIPELTIGEVGSIMHLVNNLGYSVGTKGSVMYLLPLVTSIEPNKGSKGGGTEVVITGKGFAAGATVDFQGYGCEVKGDVTSNRITCVTKASSAGVKTVTVNIPHGEDFVPATITGGNTFTYEVASTPTVASLNPTTIDAPGRITVEGTMFGTDAGNVKAIVADVECVVDSATLTDTSFECEFGQLPVGPHPMTLNIYGKGNAYPTQEVTSSAVIGSPDPAVGSVNGGTEIQLNGNGLVDGETEVTVAGKTCEDPVVTATTVTCKTPAHPAGDVDVVVTSNGILYPSVPFRYSNEKTPAVASPSDITGLEGDSVTLTGSGFATSYEKIFLIIKDNVVEKVQASAGDESSVTFALPAASTGEYEARILVAGEGLSNAITITYGIGITDIEPKTGGIEGGLTVTVTGEGFHKDETVVEICGEECILSDPEQHSGTTYVCKTPKSAQTTDTTCDVVVRANGLEDTLADGFSYSASDTPTVTDVSPHRGGTGGGTSVTISGSGFGTDKNAITVTIGGTNCPVDSTVSDKIICTTDPSVGSKKSRVQVHLKDTGYASSSEENDDYWYIDLWSSKYTWGGEDPPGDGDFVVVREGQTLLLDEDTGVLKMLLIQGGGLIFDEKDIELQAEFILVMDGGLLQVGTETEPFQHKAIITMHGHPRSKEIPIYGAKALAVRDGTLDLHGKDHELTWTRLEETAAVGDTSIKLQEAVTWEVDDLIAIATTGGKHSQRETETRHITSVTEGGTRLHFDLGLEYEHLGITLTTDFETAETFEVRAEVGLLSHNVLFRGSNNDEWHDVIEKCEDGFDAGEFAKQTCFSGKHGEEIGSDEFGAHIIMHQSEKDGNRITGRISNVELTYVGQAFRLGRYPVHFHLNGNMSGSYVKKCGIYLTFNRAVNIHGTHYVLVEMNVIYNIMGGAFFLEDGIETKNSLLYNLAMFVLASSSLLNDDATAAAFWITNPDNIVIGNVAAGIEFFCYWYRMHEHPSGPSSTKEVFPRLTDIGEFRDNLAHSCGRIGLWIFEQYYPTNVAKYENFRAYGCNKGAECVKCGNVQFIGLRLVANDEAAIEYKMIENVEQYDKTNGPAIKDAVILSYHPDFPSAHKTTYAISLPFGNGLACDNIKVAHFDQSGSAVFKMSEMQGTCSHHCGGWEVRTSQFESLAVTNKVKFSHQNEFILVDTDGTFVGSQSTIVPTTGILPSGCEPAPDAFNVGVPASKCTGSSFHRFSLNKAVPNGLNGRDFFAANDNGNTSSIFRDKSATHKDGWLVILAGQDTYDLTFGFADHLTNFSYSGTIHGFDDTENDYVILRQYANQPDKFSIDGNFYEDVGEALDPTKHHHGDWHWEDNKLSYLVSGRLKDGKSMTPGNSLENADVDRMIKVEAKQCYFKNCEKPQKASDRTSRPDPPNFWSETATWDYLEADQKNEANKPKGGIDLTIPPSSWVVIDEKIPSFNFIKIFGALEFEDGLEIDLEAAAILIYGRLVIGWPDTPYNSPANVILTGSHASNEYIVDGGPPFGTKAMGVYGRLDLHGKKIDTPWTSLLTTATKGQRELSLEGAVDWEEGWQVLVSSTGYTAREREIRTIASLSDDKRTITLNEPLEYTHLVTAGSFEGDRGYKFSAKVAALYRNIQIMGNDYADTEAESFGARLFVTTASGPDPDNAENQLFYEGVAQIEDIMFNRCGQEGFTDPFDPRYCVAFINVNIPEEEAKQSWVKNNVFRHSYSTAIGIYGSDDVHVENNVIEHSVGSALIGDSENLHIKGNLITTVLNVGTYQDRFEPKNIRVEAGLDLTDATNPVVANNIVSGTERSGFRYKGQECDADCSWTGNEVHSCMIGLATFLSEDELVSSTCVKFCGNRIFRCIEYSIYYNHEASVIVDDLVSVESGVGLMAFVIGPSATNHLMADKFVKVQNSIFVGNSADFDCEGMEIDWTYDNLRIMTQARSMAQKKGKTGRIGVISPTYTSGSNNPPLKPWAGIMAYNAIKGLTTLDGNVFSDFTTKCGTDRSFAIAANDKNDDLIHEMILKNSLLVRTSGANKVFIPEPNVGKINPSDCLDMDCDGLKKVLIRDLDGSFLGGVGTVLSKSDRWWDDDSARERGLGDYRIPKILLTDKDGSRVDPFDIAPYRGIVGNKDCVYKVDWQAYSCQDMEFVMLVIESMDEDSELRRLSPVAILNGQQDKAYIDLINGPQDHGWCAGYTCQKRLSLFHAIVDSRYTTKVVFTSNPPQITRLLALNTDKTFIVAIKYIERYRLDVFANGVFVYPKNAIISESGKFEYEEMSPEDCIPDKTDKLGANCIVDNFMYVVMKGSGVLEIRTTPQVVVGFRFMSTEDFFGENIVENLAVFLGIPKEKIRVVNVISESSPIARKKRSTMYVKFIQIECGDSPENTEGNHMTQEELEAVAGQIVDSVLLDDFPVGPGNSQPITVTLVEPVPPVNSEAWAEIEPDVAPVTLSKAGSMSFYEPAVPGREGQPFPTPMRLRVYDDSGAPITTVGSTANPWRVQATLIKGAGSHNSAQLGGTTLVSFNKGWANFTDLYITHAGEDYNIKFTVVYPSAANFTQTSPDIVVIKRDMAVHVDNMTDVVLEDTPLTLSLGLMDRDTGLHVDNVDWKGHTWSVSATVGEGSLDGTTTVNIDAGTGLATFSDLQFNEIGHYYVSFVVVSDPAEYIVTFRLHVEVTNSEVEDEPKEKTAKCEFKVDAEFDEEESPKDVARFATKWAIKNKDKSIKITNINAREGSIIATMEVQGRTSNVNSVLQEMCEEIEEEEVYMFGGKYTTLEPYMKIDGKMAYAVSCGPVPKKNELHPGIIAAIVIAVLIVVVIVVLVVFWRCYIVPKNKTYDTRKSSLDSTRDLRFLTANGRYNIEDYLFREKTLNNVKNQVPAQSAPIDTTGTTFSLNVDSRLDMYDDRPVSGRSSGALPPKMPIPSE